MSVIESGLYVNNARKINIAFDDLMGFYSEGDYRTGYIRTFAMLLSTCIPDGVIENNPEYADTYAKFPLDERDRTPMSRVAFYLYYKTFEQIMRNLAMIGITKADISSPGNKELDGMALDPFSEWEVEGE